uniref:(northern house mosquito) hypothetical protein n=1 Tax=Culex pipiens TaxID=7175 RepID=A0A8D8CY09_CULPI
MFGSAAAAAASILFNSASISAALPAPLLLAPPPPGSPPPPTANLGALFAPFPPTQSNTDGLLFPASLTTLTSRLLLVSPDRLIVISHPFATSTRTGAGEAQANPISPVNVIKTERMAGSHDSVDFLSTLLL